ncbi:MAG: helix-turn-helix domain-containing protein [Phycisphaerae bacterium]
MKEYALYLPGGPDTRPWQVAVTSAGHARTPPGAPYPQGRHPLDHLFTWQRGRILQAYQAVYILAGSGVFESAEVGVQRVTKGTVLLLFPGVWHRYQPEPRTGWVESWIEMQGEAVERLERAGVISPSRPVLRVGRHGALEAAFEQCHRLVRGEEVGNAGVVGALALQILAWVQAAAEAPTGGTPSVEEAVSRTQRALAENVHRPICVEEFAAELNVSYSAMRHAFKRRFGVSPKQYHLQVRLRKAKELLQNTGLTLEEISRALGFGSGFHLSAVFKTHVGKSPTAWRAGAGRRR